MDNQHRVNRRHNLPAELKLEIVDCLPMENAVQFLANLPNRLIIHHCAPRIRRILKMIYKIAADYVRTLPAPSRGWIMLENAQNYTPQMDIFLRYGVAHCNHNAVFWPITSDAFVGYPANFFDDLIQHYYETKVPTKAVHHLHIDLPWVNPAPWPTALVQPQAGEMDVEVLEVENDVKCVLYILRNKHNSGIAFKLFIYFEGGAQCYQQMTGFRMLRVEDQPQAPIWSGMSMMIGLAGLSVFFFFRLLTG